MPVLFFFCLPASAEDGGYLRELTARAHETRLSESRDWRLLGHWRRGLFFGFRSEANARSFFLAAGGRRDPSKELDADLAAFFEPAQPDHEELSPGTTMPMLVQHPQCRFPARYAFLKKELAFDPARLPEQPCAGFEAWAAGVAPESATLIFASAYLYNPSSMYGHTFLRLDHSKTGESAPLLDYTLNYSAVTDETNGMLYAVKGLVGWYPGRYAVMPYYMKVQEYSNLEARDLWEYRLELSTAAMDRLVRHSWELGAATFPYYFFNKNCSYQLLPLLEAAEPSLRLTPERPVWVIPADTARLVADTPGLVRSVRYRPSHLQLLRRDRARLDPTEVRAAEALVLRPVDGALKTLDALPEARQALVLDAAEDYLKLKAGHSPLVKAEVREREAALLERRSRLPTRVEEPFPTPPAPHDGHRSARLDLAGGAAQGRGFGEVAVRAALHDLMDAPEGYTPDSQLEMGTLRVRYDVESGRASVREVKVVDLRSISVWDPWARKPSWEVRTGLYSGAETGRGDDRAHYYGLRGGSGMGAAWEAGGRKVVYAFAEGDAGAGGALKGGWRAGGGGTAGLAWKFSKRLRALAEATALGYFAGDGRPTLEQRAGADFSVTPDLGLRLQWVQRASRAETSLSFNLYL